ncbi:autolysin, partial [Listeria monocytogenes]|nr:autolysin [Listeria monocytogenes]
MEERKLIRRRAMKQKRGVFYRKSAATTAALVSTVNILPVSVLADTLESTEAQNGVRVVETADSSQDTSTQDSVIVVEDNATNAESGTQDNSDSSNVEVVGVPESEEVPERVPANDPASEQEETEIGS